MRTPLIAGNWKMYKTVAETVRYATEFGALVKGVAGVQIAIAPPFTAVHAAAEALRGTRVGVAVQDLYWEREGAFTGEVSATMAREAGATLAIVGHSERRTLFGETDATVNRKAAAALAAQLTPIVCIGETSDQRDRGETFTVLDRQMLQSLDGFRTPELTALVVAYEPVWAIGTGRNATPAQAAEAHGHIRSRLRTWFGAEAADGCRIIYGGSVKPENSRELLAQADVDGALVGGASLDVRGFAEIVSAGQRRAV